MNKLRNKIVNFNKLRDKIAEILRDEHIHSNFGYWRAFFVRSKLQDYYSIVDAILDIKIEQKCDYYLNSFTMVCDVRCPKCNGTGRIKVKLRKLLK